MTAKRCPVCRHSLLTPTQHHGQEIDVCHHCGGLWFEKDEMNSVLSAIDNGHDNVDFSGQLGNAWVWLNVNVLTAANRCSITSCWNSTTWKWMSVMAATVYGLIRMKLPPCNNRQGCAKPWRN